MNTIADQWTLFESSVIPNTAPPIQRQQMRIAFYSGAGAMLLIQHGIASRMVNEDAAIAEIQELSDEIHSFSAMVATGEA